MPVSARATCCVLYKCMMFEHGPERGSPCGPAKLCFEGRSLTYDVTFPFPVPKKKDKRHRRERLLLLLKNKKAEKKERASV